MAVSVAVRTVNVYLTTPVVNYIYGENEDLVITQVDGSGGVFVELASRVDDEGSGVWIGADGTELHGPDVEGADAISERAEAFEDKVNAGLGAVDTRIEQLEQEIKHWQRVAGEHYSTLIDNGLGGMPAGLVTGETDEDPDPYSTAVSGIRAALTNAERNSGGMSEDEYASLRVVDHTLVGNDPALRAVMGNEEPTDDELMGSRGEAGIRTVTYKGYEFKITGMVNVGDELSKAEVMEELYDQVKGQRSEHLKDMEVENTKVKRIKH